MLTSLAVLATLIVVLVALLGVRRRIGQSLAERLDRAAARLVALEKALPADVDPATPLSLRAQCAYLQWRLPRLRESSKVLLFRSAREEVAALEKSLAELEAGRDPLGGATGVALRGFRSPVDGDLTTYSLRVPDAYDPARGWPLMVHLHGRGKLVPFQGHRAPDYGEELIVLSPYGKGSVDYMGPAEADVLAALEEVKRLYNIDADRVYLGGASMGGTGAWHLATHYPDRFAALVAASANADDRVWEQLWEEDVPEPERGSVRWALRRLEGLDSPVAYAGNLLHVPSRVIHGDEDSVVPVGHARSMVAALEKAGAETEYHEMIGFGHNVAYGQTREEQAAWLLEHRRKARPARVRYATDGRWPGAYWVKRVVPARPLELAQVTAEVIGGRAVEVTTRNCAALELDLTAAPLDAEGEVAVSVDGRDLGAAPRGRVYCVKDGDKWRRAERPTAAPPHEFALVFWRPFVIVYGTQGNDEKLKAALAREARRLAAEWRRRYFGFPRVYADSAAPEKVLKECGLVLFGGPGENSVTARALKELAAAGQSPPFVFGKGTVKLRDGAELSGDPETLGLQFAWPSPFNPRRSLAVVWGASWRALVDVNNRFGNGFDWTVHENRRWFGWALFDEKTGGPESFVKVGLFDSKWRIDPQLTWGRDAAAAAKLPGAAPRYASVAEATAEKRLWLDELLPAEVHQLRGPLGFGRSWGGRSLSVGDPRRKFEHGLGARVPSRLVYEAGGAFREFAATIGADLEGRRLGDLSEPRVDHGSMIFIVRGDGRELYRSEPLGPADEPADIVVSVSGVRRLELEVIAAGKYDWHLGSAAWGGARLEK